jgi:hypothetical protein
MPVIFFTLHKSLVATPQSVLKLNVGLTCELMSAGSWDSIWNPVKSSFRLGFTIFIGHGGLRESIDIALLF